MKLPKLGCFELNSLSSRVFYGLSEYQKIIVIGQTEHKLWLFIYIKPVSLDKLPIDYFTYNYTGSSNENYVRHWVQDMTELGYR